MKINNIACIGAGYVGGPTMCVFADNCPEINFIVVDINKDRINSWNGDLDKLPIYEPGLKEIVKRTRNKNLFFSTNVEDAILKSEMIFISVNTPTLDHGPGKGFGANLKFIKKCAEQIAKISKNNKIIVEKSTVPVKTAELVNDILKNNKDYNFEVLSNPEFLAEGTAINDLINPDRVLIGGDNTASGKKAVQQLVDIYSKWVPNEKIITTNLWSSELSKLASNAMLAQRISSINSFSAICDKTGADILEVSKAIGMDNRIGKKFLQPSVGFGGSCFKKDILNLVYLSKNYGLNEVAEYWHQVVKMNDYQRQRFSNKIIESLNNNILNKEITLFGWSFKKNTNDSRESSSIYVAHDLISRGAKIKVHDPQSSFEIISDDLKSIFNYSQENLNSIKFVDDPYEAVKGSCCIGILTEWDEFIKLDWKKIDDLLINEKVIIDGRYILKEITNSNIDFL